MTPIGVFDSATKQGEQIREKRDEMREQMEADFCNTLIIALFEQRTRKPTGDHFLF